MLFNSARKLFAKIKEWEHWPFYFFYFPISYAWPLYFIKSRSVWFYTASNPTLAFGGFEGEKKSAIYKQLPSHLCPKSLYIAPATSFDDILQQLKVNQFVYPFIVKPDIGMKGLLFRIIQNEEQLAKYHLHMPVDYIIQEYVTMPYEVSVFYCRKPRQQKGIITALIQKDLLEITGDGNSRLADLIKDHPYARSLLKKLKTEFANGENTIVPKGEKICLSHVANLFNGARFINLNHGIDGDLLSVFDAISHDNQFYYGRYDIKCISIDDLKKGRGFKILEFNGAGSVPNHIYTGTYTLWQAYKEILKHWRYLFEISEENRKTGFQYWSLKKGHRFLSASKRHFKLLKDLDEKLKLA